MLKSLAIQRSYPWTTTQGGRTITLRLMGRDDCEQVLAFAQALPEKDLLFLTTDITDPAEVDEWMRQIETHRVNTVLAEINGQLVGYGSLTYNQTQWTRHLGEIALLVDSSQRGFGLGKLLVHELFTLGQQLGLRKLIAYMLSDQRGAIQIFQRLDFKAEALLADQVMDRKGRTHDLVVMSHDITGFNG